MKLFHSPMATGDPARFLPVFVRSPLRFLLSSLTLTGTILLTTAPAPAQTFYRPLTFEQNRGQAPKKVKWLGHSSSDRALFAGATFQHRDEDDTRATAERQPVPMDNSQDRRSRHHRQATPKSRKPLQKPDPVEGTTPTGRSLSSRPQTSGDRVINGSRATLAFNVSTKGSGSMFTLNNGDAAQPVRFASTSISQISVTGSFATFS